MNAHPALPFVHAVAYATALLACSPGGIGQEGRRDSLGVVVLQGSPTDTPYRSAVEGPTILTLTEPGTKGSDTLEMASDQINAVATNGADRIYILDVAQERVIAATADGRVLWYAGRHGGGPGEFLYPAFLRVSGSGAVEVTDQGKGALVRFDSDGRVLEERSFGSAGFPHGSPVYAGRDTIVMDQQAYLGGSPVRTLDLVAGGMTIQLARLDNATLGQAKFTCGRATVILNEPPRLFSPGISWTVGPGVIAFTTQASYEAVIRRGYQPTTVVRREMRPRATSTEDVRRLFPNGRMVGKKTCLVSADGLAAEFGIEEYMPVLRGLRFAPDGTLWVERFTLPDESPRLDVFDLQRGYLGTIEGLPLPVGFLSGGRAVAPVRDAADPDVLRIGVFQLTP